MKHIIVNLSIGIIPVLALAATITLSSNLNKKLENYQTAAIGLSQPGPELLGNSLGAVMNELFAASGR